MFIVNLGKHQKTLKMSMAIKQRKISKGENLLRLKKIKKFRTYIILTHSVKNIILNICFETNKVFQNK